MNHHGPTAQANDLPVVVRQSGIIHAARWLVTASVGQQLWRSRRRALMISRYGGTFFEEADLRFPIGHRLHRHHDVGAPGAWLLFVARGDSAGRLISYSSKGRRQSSAKR